MKPPLTYFGGKTRIADKIVALLPEHRHYVEPFAGSLAVLLAKPPSKLETVNDLDGNLVNFWRMVRERPDDLARVCDLTPHSRGELDAAMDLDTPDDLERARRVWVRLTQGRGGSMRRTGWRYFSNPAGTSSAMPQYLAGYTGRIAECAARLSAVSLECRDALDLISDYGKHGECLIYADPPYLGSTRTWGNNYACEMRTDDQHAELAAALKAAQSAVVLSGYHSPLYDDLYGDWHQHEISTSTGNATGDRSRVEVLWSNRPLVASHETRMFEVTA